LTDDTIVAHRIIVTDADRNSALQEIFACMLVTSEKAGVAMKSVPVEISGHRGDSGASEPATEISFSEDCFPRRRS